MTRSPYVAKLALTFERPENFLEGEDDEPQRTIRGQLVARQRTCTDMKQFPFSLIFRWQRKRGGWRLAVGIEACLSSFAEENPLRMEAA